MLLLLHTIPISLFGGDNGFLWRETSMTVDSLLTDGRGGRVKLIIRRHLDGNTFIGHGDLPEDEWVGYLLSLHVCRCYFHPVFES
ncbi:unnamed protein product [Protopolystoma xenopodis]|uniref:Uncharacterized protein n=1 Tax=Protopolystoma xenopodis TaxID=117903 RepID=A0A448XIF6_9PLAT|nr:unnamed protein product [Protopolystoma xenopodis]